ncbi:hypothetical protein BKA67DRAFT_184354 [Truncatella angustata]|uniref:Uncharacterized protein n=1 Tax=Truncatella angustata TaxID=152316 RepID=A0A9P9A1T1_9PEZI|nr:uncharacterized protein BKA67DRAFT_184354 [Truncatella angustata]KAH6657275.1 hypothetical protein BKA67DRAFT_184354 [Truncatella angustata]
MVRRFHGPLTSEQIEPVIVALGTVSWSARIRFNPSIPLSALLLTARSATTLPWSFHLGSFLLLLSALHCLCCFLSSYFLARRQGRKRSASLSESFYFRSFLQLLAQIALYCCFNLVARSIIGF